MTDHANTNIALGAFSRAGFSHAYTNLIKCVETALSDIRLLDDVNVVLAPAVARAIQESDDDQLLKSLISQFGWRNQRFVGPVNFRELLSQLKLYPLHGVEQVGRGAYSTVYRAHNRLTREVVILKKVVVPPCNGLPSHSVREVSILKDLEHENIVRLIDVTFMTAMHDERDGGLLYLVMESLDEDLRRYMQRFVPQGLGMPTVKRLLRQLLSGIAHAHSRQVMHRDLKPENVLVDRARDLVKVGDFGLARVCGSGGEYSIQVVTLNYRAPELLLGSPHYDKGIDMWSCGCIFAELLLLRPLFYPENHAEIEMIFQIFYLLGTPDETVWPGCSKLPYWNDEFPKFKRQRLCQAIPGLDDDACNLLSRMLMLNPARRISANEALRHPFLAQQ